MARARDLHEERARRIAANLEALVGDRAWKDVSLKAGLNETAVRDIIKGRSKNPQVQTLQQLAEALNVSLSELTGDEEWMDEADAYTKEVLSMLAKPDRTSVEIRNALKRLDSLIETMQNIRTLAATDLERVAGATNDPESTPPRRLPKDEKD